MIGKREMSLSSEKMCLVNLKVRRGEDRDEGDVFVCVFVFRKNVLGQFESKKRLGEERREAVSPGADLVQVLTPGHCRGIILALPVTLEIVLVLAFVPATTLWVLLVLVILVTVVLVLQVQLLLVLVPLPGAPAVLSGRMHVSCCICRKSRGQQVLPDPRVSP